MIIYYTLPPKPTQTFRTASHTVVIGRDATPEDHIDLDLAPDTTVSHFHACITLEEGDLWIEDLGSTNGTLIAGERIATKIRIPEEGEIRLGQTLIEIEKEEVSPKQDKESISEIPGDRVAVADAAQPPFAEGQPPLSAEDSRHAWRQLKAFYDLSRGLATATELAPTLKLVAEQVQEAIPNAQRGAVLLPGETGELLLKAHWPLGSHSVSTTLVKQAFDRREAFIWSAAEGGESSPSMRLSNVQSAIYAPLLCDEQVLGVIYIDNYENREAFSLTDLELLRAIANQVAIFLRKWDLRQDLRREELLRNTLLRQFSPQLAERLMDEYNRLQLGGERVNPVTILISDVRSFTALSAPLAPESVVRMLNEMFDAFVPIIFDHDGVVDKYIGDAVLAVFGSPQQDEHQWEKALHAAQAMQDAMHKLGEGWGVRRLPIFEVGIGLHTGEVIHGFVGSAERTEYTVIGDTVNRTARYCDGAGPGEIVISQEVYERIYRSVDVEARTIETKHPETEPPLTGYLVKGLRDTEDLALEDTEPNPP